MDIAIRPAREADAPALHERCFRSSQSFDLFQAHLRFCLSHAHIVRLVALADGQVIGGGELTLRGRVGQIGSLVVAVAYRRQGIGRRLMLALLEEARHRGVERVEIDVCVTPAWLADFYGRLGFTPAGKCRLPQSFGGGEVISMSMTLDPPCAGGASGIWGEVVCLLNE